MNTDAVLDQLGVGTDVELLGKIDADAIVQASVAISGSGLAARQGFGPTLGPSLPEHPVDTVRAGSGADVNVVLGCTTHEMVAFIGTPQLFRVRRVDAARDAARHARRRRRRNLRRLPGCESRRLASLDLRADRVGPGHAHPAHPLRGGVASTAVRRTRACTCSTSAGRASTASSVRGHGADMPFFFDNLDRAPASDGPHAAPLVRAMSGALVAARQDGRSEPRRDPDVAGVLGQRPSDDGLRRRIPRRERPDVGGATRLGRPPALGGG